MTTIDQTAVEAFTGRFATDLGAVAHAATVVAGDKLGLYRALAERGPSTSEELAGATGCDERYLREWLAAQAASGYAHFDPATDRFHLDDVQPGTYTWQAWRASGPSRAGSIDVRQGVVLEVAWP